MSNISHKNASGPSGAEAPLQEADYGLLRKMLAMAWKYRRGCILPLCIQICLLSLAITGLRFTGLGIDVIRHSVDAKVPSPTYPLGISAPASWTTLHQVLAIGGAILLFSMMRGMLNLTNTIVTSRLIQGRLVVDLRSAVYEKLQRLSFRFYDQNETGSIINRVTRDVQEFAHFVNGIVMQVIMLLLSLMVYLIYMVRISPSLTMACLASTPILWYASFRYSRTMRPAMRRNRELYDRLILVLAENLSGIHVVKGFLLGQQQVDRFKAANLEYKRQQRWIFWRTAIFGPSINWLTQVNLAILLGYGGWLVIHGHLQLGAGLWVFIGLMNNVSGQVQAIANLTNSIQGSLIAARRVYEVLESPVAIESPANCKSLADARGKLEFRNVSFEFEPGKPILRDISFTVQPGQLLAILGPTGAGKSILLALIMRFYDPTAGRILLDDIDIRECDVKDLRRAMGLVFQETFLFSNSVSANVAFGAPGATREQIEVAAKIAKAHQFIVGMPRQYDTVLAEGGNNLSGGQRQRLAIARAIILQPKFLLMDDPMAAVDAQTEHEMLEAMESAMQGRTTILVSNRISTLRRADLILVLQKGRIVQRGTHEQLMNTTGHYRETARLQIDGESRKPAGAPPIAQEVRP